jgi:hypothetical protein
MNMDGRTVCNRCDATCHDFVQERNGELLLSCCFCGEGRWIYGTAPQKNIMTSGRYEGMTEEEVAMTERGREYLELKKKESKK